MKIATWNVNSIRSRLERLLRWLEKVRPDVVCLQEIKVTDGRVACRHAASAAGRHASSLRN